MIVSANDCYEGISGTLTGWAMSYLMVHISGANPIPSNHPHILDRTPYNV